MSWLTNFLVKCNLCYRSIPRDDDRSVFVFSFLKWTCAWLDFFCWDSHCSCYSSFCFLFFFYRTAWVNFILLSNGLYGSLPTHSNFSLGYGSSVTFWIADAEPAAVNGDTKLPYNTLLLHASWYLLWIQSFPSLRLTITQR